jgi:hypothetical protein
MERKQLVTIAITAVTSVIAKELVSALVAWVRNSEQTQTAKRKAKIVFSKSNLTSAAVAVWLAFNIAELWSDLRGTGPITRLTIAIIDLALFNAGLAVVWFVAHFASRFRSWRRKPRIPTKAL